MLLATQNHPKGEIAHNVLSDGSAVFLSFDIEIGGEYVGIIQLSAELVRMKLVAGRGVAQDRLGRGGKGGDI